MPSVNCFERKAGSAEVLAGTLSLLFEVFFPLALTSQTAGVAFAFAALGFHTGRVQKTVMFLTAALGNLKLPHAAARCVLLAGLRLPVAVVPGDSAVCDAGTCICANHVGIDAAWCCKHRQP